MISNEWTTQVLEALSNAPDDEVAYVFPDGRSTSADAFSHHHVGALGVLLITTKSAIFADNAAYVAAAIVNRDVPLPTGFDPHKMLTKTPGPHLRRLGHYQRQLLEMVYIRIVDNLLTYVIDVIAECIRANPNLIKSAKENISTEVALSFENMDDLKTHLLERKIISIAYQGIEGQCEWIENHLGVRGLRNIPAYPSVIEMIEFRNCMVHNRSRAGDKCVRALQRYGVAVKTGQKLEASMDDLFVAGSAAFEFATYLDRQLVEKFSLQVTA
jgi:hypothetical protein